MSIEIEPARSYKEPLKLVEMTGPTALGGGWRRFWSLAWMVGLTEFRLSYFGSVLGYFWTLIQPLLMFGTYLVVFTEIFKVNGDTQPAHWASILLFNIMLFQFFVSATSGAVQSVVAREGMVRKMQFPRLVIPMSVVITALLNLATQIMIAFAFALATGVTPRLQWLLFPIALIPLVFFTVGVSMWLSAAYVKYRDVLPIWTLVSQVLFYASPVLYAVSNIDQPLLVKLLHLSPLTGILSGIHAILIDPQSENARAIGMINSWGGMPHALIPIGFIVFVFISGLWYFNRQAQTAAELL